MNDDKLMEGMYFSDRCAFCSEFGKKKRPHVCERCFTAAMELAASEHPAPPPQVVRGEGVVSFVGGVSINVEPPSDNFRSDAVALARLVLDYDKKCAAEYNGLDMLDQWNEICCLARKLTGEQEGEQ